MQADDAALIIEDGGQPLVIALLDRVGRVVTVRVAKSQSEANIVSLSRHVRKKVPDPDMADDFSQKKSRLVLKKRGSNSTRRW